MNSPIITKTKYFVSRDYNGRDVTLILNGKASFYNIRYIAVYDEINGKFRCTLYSVPPPLLKQNTRPTD